MAKGRLQREPAILQAARAGQAKIGILFGGQGYHNNKCLDELSRLKKTEEEAVGNLLQRASYWLHELASNTGHASGFHDDFGFNLEQWLREPSSGPPKEHLALAPVSFPLNTLLALAHYCVACRRLSSNPGQFNSALSCVVGYSQGIFPAVAVARSHNWNSFWEAAELALRLSFGVGLESHLASPPSSIAADARQLCIDLGHGDPSPMLSIAGLSKALVASFVREVNERLHDQQEGLVHLALEVSRDRCIVAGPTHSLWKLYQSLQQRRAPEGLDQSRVTLSERKPVIDATFLPISAPFHSANLEAVEPLVMDTVAYSSRPSSSNLCDIALPIIGPHAEVLSDVESDRDLAAATIRAVTVESVEWLRVSTTLTQTITHLLDFGPGRMGDLTLQNTLGTGLTVINMTDITRRHGLNVLSQAEFYSNEMPPQAMNWETKFGPRTTDTSLPYKPSIADNALTTGSGGSRSRTRQIKNKVTAMFGTPPIMVAGMTPTSIHPDFVAAVMKAGYYAELAGGGYTSEARFEKAIRELAAEVPPHRGIICNLIYASPQKISWQISCLRRLIREGINVSGITIGAGVPSDEAVAEYIETMGLSHISFKPANAAAIHRIVSIAKNYPHFPIGLQWTGGRAGGHHSTEDFHDVISREYASIRACENVVLIAGSGFGGGRDSLPYLNGEWSLAYGYPRMPFDGILLGSRLMVAQEAHTSPAVKKLLIETEGVDDAGWHDTFRRPCGGIITIQSEMGQPIHMLATRGVMLWKELDERVFSIKDPTERLQYLQKHHDEIVMRLNDDYAKPWFAVNSSGHSVRLEDMTYNEVLQRMMRLLYVRHQDRWIDSSYKSLLQQYLDLAADRFGRVVVPVDSLKEGMTESLLTSFAEGLGSDGDEVLYPEDAALLLALFGRRGQKPVPFVPTLDANFETFFKKDCLWQAEDVDAVVDQDAQRVSIIHGPVAARFSTSGSESAADILDNIHQYWIDSLEGPPQAPLESSDVSVSPRQWSDMRAFKGLKISNVSSESYIKRYELLDSAGLPSTSHLFRHLAGDCGWLQAALVEERIYNHLGWTDNTVRAAFTPQLGDIVELQLSGDSRNDVESATLLSCRGKSSVDRRLPVIRLSCHDAQTVLVAITPSTVLPLDAPMVLRYMLDQDSAGSRLYVDRRYGPENRAIIREMYRHLMLPNMSNLQHSMGFNSEFYSRPITLSSARVHQYEDAIRRLSPNQIPSWTPNMPVPLDFSAVIGWEGLMGPLILNDDFECNFTRLLHQSIDIAQSPSAEPLRIGDVVHTMSRITGLASISNGRRVEVTADIMRRDSIVVTIKTEFFMREDDTSLKVPRFESSHEPDMLFSVDSAVHEAILTSRKWFHLNERGRKANLGGLKLIFQLTSHTTYDTEGRVSSLQVSGDVSALGDCATDLVRIGSVYFEDDSQPATNIVMNFLSRHGANRYPRQLLDQPGWASHDTSTVLIQAPIQSRSYAAASSDHNPIHVCRTFARYAGLDGVIVHGMHTSAIMQRLLQSALGDLSRSRLHRWKVTFQEMVRPRDILRVKFRHYAMEQGAMVIQVEVFNDQSGDRVLEAEAMVEQAPTAYVFGGQGGQAKGMGMELYATSPDAKRLWDRGDAFLRDKFGFSILEIVRDNPQHLLVSFGGKRGRNVRSNYLAMKKPDLTQGRAEDICVVSEIHVNSTSHTFTESRGLLFSTQFSQPALALMEIAEYEHLQASGMVQPDAPFAGHSLGEYAALGACTSFMKLEDLLELVFYRGLKMQNALTRDANGRTDFAMVAVDPSRVSKGFDESALQKVVLAIREETKLLLEVVNYNVESHQYVCAGHFRSLWIMTQVLDSFAQTKDRGVLLTLMDDTQIRATIRSHATTAQSLTNMDSLERGKATISLSGIDIPFHSTLLHGEIEHYREYLSKRIPFGAVKSAELVQRWIPNVMGTPFSLDRSYLEQVIQKTNSGPLRHLLAQIS